MRSQYHMDLLQEYIILRKNKQTNKHCSLQKTENAINFVIYIEKLTFNHVQYL